MSGLSKHWLVVVAVSACAGAVGCSDDDVSTADGSVVDAADVGVDVEEVPPLRIGSPHTLEIATWNIRNFPTEPATVDRVAELLNTLQLDLVAVQEVEDASAWHQMLEGLNARSPQPYDTALSPHEYFPGTYQKVGFVWRTDLITLLDWELLYVDDDWAFPRPPMQGRFTAVHPGGWTLEFIAIAVHLKASQGWENEQRRAAAVQLLAEHVDGLAGFDGTPDPVEPEVVILGDFNDRLEDPVEYNVFEPLLNAPEHYQALTLPLEQAGEYTVLPWYGFIDHLFITADLQYEYAGGRTLVIGLDRAAELYDTELGYVYTDAVSDHLPVVAILPWVDY